LLQFCSCTERTLTSVLYLWLASIGLLAYVFVCVVLCVCRKSFTNTFYILLTHCAIGDIAYLLLNIVYVVPFSIANRFLIDENVAQFLANLNTVFYSLVFILVGPISLNRLMAILGTFSGAIQKSWIYMVRFV
jgi:hypothetical protein